MKRKMLLALVWILAFSSVAAAVILAGYDGMPAGRNTASLPPMPEGFAAATVQRIVDGDTIVVDIDGTQHRVRLILVDTPESVHPDAARNNEYGKLASAYTAEQLSIGATVYLQKDVSETDRYGRLLRYAWTAVPADIESEAEVRTKMYNARLLLEGYAQMATYPPDVKYADMFTAFQAEARDADKGLWAYEEAAPAAEAVPEESGYIGNKNSQVLHRPDCAGVAQMKPANQVYFDHYDQALDAGYAPCGNCKPVAAKS